MSNLHSVELTLDEISALIFAGKAAKTSGVMRTQEQYDCLMGGLLELEFAVRAIARSNNE